MKKAQVWVETVIYTLIGLTLIGLVLGVATPKINRMKDKAAVEQGMVMLNEINSKITAIKEVPGNQREIKLRIKKGRVDFDCGGDKIIFVLEESGLELSEPGEEIAEGDLIIETTEKGRKYDISVTLDYSQRGIDLKYNGNEVTQTLETAASEYKLLVRNNGAGADADDKLNFDIKLIS